MVLLTCNPSAWEAKAGRSLVPGQLGPHSKTLSQNNNNKIALRVSGQPPFYHFRGWKDQV
jgi:hypothetical protein